MQNTTLHSFHSIADNMEREAMNASLFSSAYGYGKIREIIFVGG
jgi:hypothetical protein